MTSLHVSKSNNALRLRCALYLCGCVVLLLSGCQRYDNKPQCSEVISKTYTGYFDVTDDGLARDRVTGKRWYRCNAGERFKDGQCVGEPVELAFEQALSYAQEFSQASGREWRLPTQDEMATLRLDHCVNPSINPNVFPSVMVNNYWTSTASNRNKSLGCTTYTYDGNNFCSERKDVARPFLLVVN